MSDKDYEALYNEKCETVEYLYNLVCELTQKNEKLEKDVAHYRSKVRELELSTYVYPNGYTDT